MALTDEQFAWLRSELGVGLDRADVDARYDRIGAVRDVAVEVLRERRAALLDGPLSVNVPGAVSVNSEGNVRALERQIDALLALADADPSTRDVVEGPSAEGAGVEVTWLVPTRGR